MKDPRSLCVCVRFCGSVKEDVAKPIEELIKVLVMDQGTTTLSSCVVLLELNYEGDFWV